MASATFTIVVNLDSAAITQVAGVTARLGAEALRLCQEDINAQTSGLVPGTQVSPKNAVLTSAAVA